MKTAIFDRFELELPDDCVASCSAHGACDDAVSRWARVVPRNANPDDIRRELKEYGAWTAEQLADDDANWERIIWIAACNIRDEEREDSTWEEITYGC